MFERDRNERPEDFERREGATGEGPREPQPHARRKPLPWVYIGAAALILLSLGVWLASC